MRFVLVVIGRTLVRSGVKSRNLESPAAGAGERGYWGISTIGLVKIFSSTDGGGKRLSFLFYQAARRQIKKILFFLPSWRNLDTPPLYNGCVGYKP